VSRVLSVAVLVLWSCGLGPVAGPQDPPPASADLRLLFVGNSLTYTNDLPAMTEALVEANSSLRDIYVESVSLPGFGLQDHWAGLSNARERIAAGGWDYVILQQGPSATEGRPSLLDYTMRFSAEIKAVGGRPALYMVWPDHSRPFDFDGVSDSYRTAAAQVEGLVFPAGEAWRAAWAQDTTLALYGPDGFHPSRMGTYLAALVIFEQLTGENPLDLPAVIPGPGSSTPLSPGVAQILHSAAVQANAQFALP